MMRHFMVLQNILNFTVQNDLAIRLGKLNTFLCPERILKKASEPGYLPCYLLRFRYTVKLFRIGIYKALQHLASKSYFSI